MANVGIYCCCSPCILPETTDTLTLSLRNGSPCSSTCYEYNPFGPGLRSFNNVVWNPNGDYLLSWVLDTPSLRRFSTGDLESSATFDAYGLTADCSGTGNPLSDDDNLTGAIIDFILETGCISSISFETFVRPPGLSGSGSLEGFYRDLSSGDTRLGEWYPTDGTCAASAFYAGPVTGASGTEGKVVIN